MEQSKEKRPRDVYELDDGQYVQLDDDRCLCNDICFGHEYHPHHPVPWMIGNEYGMLCLVWASNEQDALDIAADAGMLDGLAMEEKDVEYDDDGNEINTMRLGNTSEPFCSDYAWMHKVRLTHEQELRFAEARGAVAKTLDAV
jgi:hypothetical protein